jgi:pilus assembly protein CpaE
LADEAQPVRCVLISTDPDFRDVVKAVLSRMQAGAELGLEITVAFTEIGDEHLNYLRDINPELIFLDLESDPEVGTRFAHFLTESDATRRVIAAGPELSSEQLIAAMRAGISEYLPKPVSKESLTAAIDRVERKLGWSLAGGSRNPGRVYSVFSAKGGSGATTLATNLATMLHRVTGKKTLLVDLDLELGEISLLLGVEPRFNFVDLVRSFHRMDAGLLASYIEQHESGVHLLSAPYIPNRAESVSGDQIKKILNFLRQHYHYVIVDTSKSLSPATLAAFEQSDHIFLVTTVDLPSLRNVKRCEPLIEQAIGASADQRLRLVISRYNPADTITIKDVEKTLGIKVFKTIRNDYKAVIESINTGHPAVLNGDSKYSEDVRSLATAVAGLQAEKASDGKSSSPMKLFKRALGKFRKRKPVIANGK